MTLDQPLERRARKRPDSAETGRMWEALRTTGDLAVREKLVTAYMGFARMMAAKVYAKRFSGEIEFEDYLQYARVGLIEAVDRFDPQRGVLFESFAAIRITGAVLTGLESASEIQRQISARKRVIGVRIASLNHATPQPTGAEAVFARLAELALGLAVGLALEESNMYMHEEGIYADNTYSGFELRQLKSRVSAAVELLAGSQRRVIQSHYLQHMSFDEVAESMELSPGRISQIHREALENLRGRLNPAGKIDLHC